MNPEKQKEADALEKKLKRLIQKLGNEKEALTKILKSTGSEPEKSGARKQERP